MSDAKKTLLPELLPAPRPEVRMTPRGRVDLRAERMLERLRGLKTAAGAAVLAAQVGCYQVVDSLPPPAAQCTDRPDPFTALGATGYASATDGGQINAVVTLNSYQTIGFRVDAVRVTAGGTLISVEDMSHDGFGGQTQFSITIAPDGSGTPITLEVDLGCGAATTTKRYSISVAGTGTYVVTEV